MPAAADSLAKRLEKSKNTRGIMSKTEKPSIPTYVLILHCLLEKGEYVRMAKLKTFRVPFKTLLSYIRWPREDGYDESPPSCDQRFHTEATPYVAVILSKTSGNFLCMGSILGPYHVLTVRECLLRDEVHDILVMAGYLSAWWGREAQVKNAKEIVKSDEDLAIIRLRKKFRFSKNVKPIKLSSQPKTTPHQSYGTSYGTLGFLRAPWDVPGEPMPKSAYYELKPVTLMVDKDIETCQKAYADVSYFNSSSMFCTYANTSFCWGNLGSPTVVLVDEQIVQMGIVIRAFCDENKVPNLHLRIDAYEGWIRSNSDAKLKKL